MPLMRGGREKSPLLVSSHLVKHLKQYMTVQKSGCGCSTGSCTGTMHARLLDVIKFLHTYVQVDLEAMRALLSPRGRVR
jgi:hypothetical protein